MCLFLQGQAYVNGFNLGRYWPVAGPQDTLYVPATVLSSGQQPSKLVLLELDQAPCDKADTCVVEFVSKPVLNGPVTPLKEVSCNAAAPLECMKDWSSKYARYMPPNVRTNKQALDILKQWG